MMMNRYDASSRWVSESADDDAHFLYESEDKIPSQINFTGNSR